MPQPLTQCTESNMIDRVFEHCHTYRKSAFMCEWCRRAITLSDRLCSVASEAERRERANTTGDVLCQRELRRAGYQDA